MSVNARFWDQIAEKYAAQPIANVPAWERKLAFSKARLRPADVVLDLGCGTGSLAIELAPHVSQVHALDCSGAMLEIARRKAAAQSIENITFLQGTVQEPPAFEPASFDVVCAYSILHLVPERAALLRQVMGWLKPGGLLIASTLVLRDSRSLVPYSVVLPVLRWLGRAPVVALLSTEELLAELRAAGFNELVTPDVGAKREVAFVAAKKPA